MNRHDWEFSYPTKRIAQASFAKMKFHRERQSYWNTQFEEAFTKMKESVTYKETPIVSRGGTYAMSEISSNKMTDIDVLYDPQLKRDMENKRTKLTQHKALADNYEAYYHALSSQADSMNLSLSVEDVIYFGLAGWKPEDETAKDE